MLLVESSYEYAMFFSCPEKLTISSEFFIFYVIFKNYNLLLNILFCILKSFQVYFFLFLVVIWFDGLRYRAKIVDTLNLKYLELMHEIFSLPAILTNDEMVRKRRGEKSLSSGHKNQLRDQIHLFPRLGNVHSSLPSGKLAIKRFLRIKSMRADGPLDAEKLLE